MCDGYDGMFKERLLVRQRAIGLRPQESWS